MKIHLARCDVGSSPWRDAVERVTTILTVMKSVNTITSWKNVSELAGEGYVEIHWTWGFAESTTETGKFGLAELRPHMIPVIEVMES